MCFGQTFETPGFGGLLFFKNHVDLSESIDHNSLCVIAMIEFLRSFVYETAFFGKAGVFLCVALFLVIEI